MVAIKKNHFTNRDEAVNEIASLGLHLYDTEAEEGTEDETHWHPYDTHIDVLEGEYEHREPDLAPA